jgi:hypothetical protein
MGPGCETYHHRHVAATLPPDATRCHQMPPDAAHADEAGEQAGRPGHRRQALPPHQSAALRQPYTPSTDRPLLNRRRSQQQAPQRPVNSRHPVTHAPPSPSPPPTHTATSSHQHLLPHSCTATATPARLQPSYCPTPARLQPSNPCKRVQRLVLYTHGATHAHDKSRRRLTQPPLLHMQPPLLTQCRTRQTQRRCVWRPTCTVRPSFHTQLPTQ